jgi:hypothetical protein
MRPAQHPGFTLTVFSVVAVTLLLEGGALAEGVEEAQELYLEADFPGALEAFSEMLESEGLDVETAVEVHRYLAALYLITEELDDAQRHAEAAVALQPDVEAPEGAPPELNDIFDEVRADQGEDPVTISIEAGEEGLVPRRDSTVIAELVPPARAIASRLDLWCSGDLEEAADTSGSPPRVELVVVPDRDGQNVHCEAAAETRGGAIMVEAEQDLEVTEGSGRRRRRSGRRIWPWALGFGGGAVIVGAIIAGAVVGSRPDNAFIDAPQVPGW